MEIFLFVFRILSLLAMYFIGYKRGIKFCQDKLNFYEEDEEVIND